MESFFQIPGLIIQSLMGNINLVKAEREKNKGKHKLKNERNKKCIQFFSAARKVVTINRFVKTFLRTA